MVIKSDRIRLAVDLNSRPTSHILMTFTSRSQHLNKSAFDRAKNRKHDNMALNSVKFFNVKYFEEALPAHRGKLDRQVEVVIQ